MAWIPMVGRSAATGQLAAAYAALGRTPQLPAYRPAHGDVPEIIRVHSLDPELLVRTFTLSAQLRDDTLPWSRRELVNTATARANDCFY